MGLFESINITDLLREFGLTRGLFVCFFFIAHFWIFVLYSSRVKDRKEEIERLAKDNHLYRDRFLALLDDRFGYEE